MKETIRKRLKKQTREKGITLMVLVITIIVLLILAAVTTKLVFGEGEILGETKEAVNEWDKATEEEQSDLAKLAQEMRNARNGIYNGTSGGGSGGTGEGGGNNNETGGGSESGGNEETPKSIDEITGEETTNTEVVDENGDKAFVPAGFTVDPENNTVVDGLVIIDKKGGNADTVGNEFVWIPCTLDGANNTLKYDRYVFTRADWNYRQSLILGSDGEYEKDSDGSYKIQILYFSTSYYYHEAMPEQERASIEKYGGFYIGRYEVGADSARGTSSKGDIRATARIKTNLPVYNYVTRDEAVTIAERMYAGKSRLCSSYAWDTVLKFIDGESGTYAVNSEGGNYSLNGGLKNTGYNAMKNIFDMGGNVSEWTTENSTRADNPCVHRRWRLR